MPAKRAAADPVHYHEVIMWHYDGTPEPPGWYFWHEGGSGRAGPFDTEALARAALKVYAQTTLKGR